MANDKSTAAAYDDSMPLLATRSLVAGHSEASTDTHNEPAPTAPHDIAPNTTMIGTDRVVKTIQTEPPVSRKQSFVQGFEATTEQPPSFGSKKTIQTTPPRPVHERTSPSPAMVVRRQSGQTYQTISDNDETGFEQTNPRMTPVVDGLVSRQAGGDDAYQIPARPNRYQAPEDLDTPSLKDLVEADIRAIEPTTMHHEPQAHRAPEPAQPRMISLDPAERQRRREALRNGTTYTPPRDTTRAASPARESYAGSDSPEHDQELDTQAHAPREPRPVHNPVRRTATQPVPTTGSTHGETGRAKDPFTSKRDSRQNTLKTLILSGFALTVAVLAFMVWQVSSLSTQLAEAQEALYTVPAAEALAMAMAEHEDVVAGLEYTIDDLKDQIADLQFQLWGPPPTYEGDSDEADATPVPQPVQVGYTIEQTHTVESGQNINGIAQMLLGSTAYGETIMAANGITNPASLQLGQVLTIPSVPIAEHTPSSARP